MKRYISIIALLCVVTMASAQTQHGYVKTKGRMVNGKLVPGQGLKGATISIKGRTAVLVNNNDGSFSFPVIDKQFRIDSVRKKGYQLVDVEACPRTYQFSNNPLYIVMETPDQQLQDQLAAERKIRRTLTQQLQQREDEIEALKAQKKISDEEYRQALQKLYEEADQNEKLVKDMVERYSKIDYDQLDEFNRQISNYILDGALAKADSLLRTKGDINERIMQLRQHESINAKEQLELEQRQEQLNQSKMLAQKELEDLANDCFRKYEIFNMQRVYDSAVYFIEIRASLDTMNPQWQRDAAGYYMMPREKSMVFYKRATALYQSLAKDNPGQYDVKLAETMNDLADCYGKTEMRRMDLRERALEICRDYEQTYSMSVYNDMIWLRVLKDLIRDYSYNDYNDEIVALSSEIGMLTNRMSAKDYAAGMSQDDLDALLNDALEFYLVLGSAYYNNQIYDKAEAIYSEMLGYFDLFEELDRAKSPMKARAYWALAEVYAQTGRIQESEEKYIQSLDLIEGLREEMPIAYRVYRASALYLLGFFYFNLDRYDECGQRLREALEECDAMEKEGKSSEQVIQAHSRCMLGFIMVEKGQFSEALALWEESAAIYREIIGSNKMLQTQYLTTLQSLSIIYNDVKDYQSSYNTNEELLALQKTNYEADKNTWAKIYSESLANQSYNLIFLKEFDKAVQYAEKALEVYPDEHMPVTNQAAALLLQGKTAEAEQLYRQYAKELKENFLADFDAFEEAGIIPAGRKNDVERMRKLLKE